MRIRDLAFAHDGARAGSNGAWRVEHSGNERTIFHYGTVMLRWTTYPNGLREVDYASTGWGSVSDQGGMNQLFRALGAPLYFSRKGGAEIRRIDA